jgi:pectin methylesterase-like acyl-CoA thioesterase
VFIQSSSQRSGFFSLSVWVAILFLALSIVVSPRIAHAQSTFVVDEDGNGTATDCDAAVPAFNTIQAAVNAAIPGDTIFICPGTFDEQVTITTSGLTIRGSDAGSTVIRPAVVAQNAVRPGSIFPVTAILLMTERSMSR